MAFDYDFKVATWVLRFECFEEGFCFCKVEMSKYKGMEELEGFGSY